MAVRTGLLGELDLGVKVALAFKILRQVPPALHQQAAIDRALLENRDELLQLALRNLRARDFDLDAGSDFHRKVRGHSIGVGMILQALQHDFGLQVIPTLKEFAQILNAAHDAALGDLTPSEEFEVERTESADPMRLMDRFRERGVESDPSDALD